MAGTWMFNLLLGLFGFLLVVLLSFAENSILTAFIRGFVTFVSFFFVGYIFRWMLAYIKEDNNQKIKISNPTTPQMNESEMQQLMNSFTEEEAKKTAEYIRGILRNDRG
jgi:hypothetical protein